MRDSNSHERFWRPSYCHCMNPLYSIEVFIYLQNCTLKYILYIFFIILSTFQLLETILNISSILLPLSLNLAASAARLSLRPISDSQLHALLHFHLCPIYLVVFKGSYRFCGGYLILRGASRLDAFSVYPFPTWLPGRAIGMTTGAQEVSPTRSSRTKVSSSQISCAHAG